MSKLLQAGRDSANISGMKRDLEAGSISVLLIPLILVAVFFLVAVGFAYWAFSGKQDYKNNVDSKVQTAVAANTQAVQASDAVQYAQEAKKPFRTYSGPSQYGSLQIQYPKTWSAYVDETGHSSANVNGYFNPGFVPSLTDQNSVFALRAEIVNQSYSQVLQQLSSNVQSGKVKAKPYSFPKVPSIIGTRFDGEIQQNKQGSMVVIPLRSGSLELWTESSQYLNDFNKNILPNITFSP